MTRRSSLRASAREIYEKLAKGQGANALPNTPLPDPPPQGGREQTEQGVRAGASCSTPTAETSLTARVRALYEDSAVPVAAIAQLVGVSERTIYKYVAKHRWTRRHRRMADGSRPAAFTPAKGAGGRFIRRADTGRPFARGLKATDPAGAARAQAACAGAARLAAGAQARAEAAARRARQFRTIIWLNRALTDLTHVVVADARRCARTGQRKAPRA